MYEALVARVRYHIQKANFVGLKEAESTLLLGEAADAIEQLIEERDAYRKAMTDERNRAARLLWDKEHCWIPVTERLPEPEGHSEYIVCVKHFNPEYTRNVLVTTAEFEARLIECGDGPYWVGHNDGITRVTHWMPLPPAPKEE